MDTIDIFGAEDNPFSLFLVLVLLLGAMGFFDPQEKTVEDGVQHQDMEPDRSKTTPVWRKRPASFRFAGADGKPVVIKPLAVGRTVNAGRICRRPAVFIADPRQGSCHPSRLFSAYREKGKGEALRSFVRNFAAALREFTPQEFHFKHPLLRLRHKMLQ